MSQSGITALLSALASLSYQYEVHVFMLARVQLRCRASLVDESSMVLPRLFSHSTNDWSRRRGLHRVVASCITSSVTVKWCQKLYEAFTHYCAEAFLQQSAPVDHIEPRRTIQAGPPLYHEELYYFASFCSISHARALSCFFVHGIFLSLTALHCSGIYHCIQNYSALPRIMSRRDIFMTIPCLSFFILTVNEIDDASFCWNLESLSFPSWLHPLRWCALCH